MTTTPTTTDRPAICRASGAPIAEDRTDGNGHTACPTCGRLVVTDRREPTILNPTRTIRAHRPLDRSLVAVALHGAPGDAPVDVLALTDLDAFVAEAADVVRLLYVEAADATRRGDALALGLIRSTAAELGDRLTDLAGRTDLAASVVDLDEALDVEARR